MKEFLSKNKFKIILFVVILLAAFLRLWRLPEYMTFLGDEGRDALAVKHVIVDHRFRLIGPVTSIGNMYLGPLYYYLILPAMFIFKLSPVGPALMVAVLGIITVYLIYLFGKEWIGEKGAMIAAFLYAISPTVIIYSRSSWNPNVMPFFALLSLFGIWRVWQKRQFIWLPILGITLSFCIQSHYLGLLIFPTVFIFWLITLIEMVKKKEKLKTFFLQTLLLLVLFGFLTVLPLVWFDLRHGSINANAFKEFFTVRQTTVNLKPYKAIPKFVDLTVQVFTRLISGKDAFWGPIVSGLTFLFLLIFLVFDIFKKKTKGFLKENKGIIFLFVWFLVGLFGLGNYKQNIYDHYFGFFFPVPFLFIGWLLARICNFKKIKIGALIVVLVLAFLTFLSFKESPLRYPPNNQFGRTQEVAKFVIEKSEDKPFNLALIAERNYDDAYAFFLEIWGYKPVRIEPLNTEETITDQLFVICEKLPCEPINHPKAEIAMFGWVEIEQKWDFKGVEVYKLVHTEK